MSKWVEVKDEEVRHVWKCEGCGKVVTVSPDSYATSGTPICHGTPECEGDDLTYARTELLTGYGKPVN